MTTYTLFGQVGSGPNSATTGARTIGVQFSVSQSCTLEAAWFYSGSGLTQLPTGIVCWDADTGTAVESVLSASWSGAPGSGWVRALFAGTTTLNTGVNYVCSFTNTAAGVAYYTATVPYAAFQSTGGGVTSGILTAPNTSNAVHGQAPFSTSYDTNPATSSSGDNFWIDVEVSAGTAHTATAALTVTPSFSVARQRGKFRTGALTVTPSFTAGRQRGKYRTGALTVTPSLSAARTRGRYRSAALTVTPSFSAARTRGRFRTAALAIAAVFSAARQRGRHRTASLTVTPVLFASAGARPVPATSAPTVTQAHTATAAVTQATTSAASVTHG